MRTIRALCAVMVGAAAVGTVVAGPVPAAMAETRAVAKTDTSVELDRIVSPITYPARVSIKGHAYREDGTPSSNWTVRLQGQRVGTDTWGTMATGRTVNGSGAFRFDYVQPVRNYRFRVVYDGSDVYNGSISGVRGVNVRPSITLGFSDGTPAAGRKFRFFGTVRPHPGHLGDPVTVEFTRGSETWTRTLSLDLDSRYEAETSLQAGTYHVITGKPGDEYNAAGSSQLRYLVVH